MLKSKTFLSYLFSFLSIVILPLSAVFLFLNTTFNSSIQTQILQYESQLMQSVSEQVDLNISYSVHISYYLSGNKSFQRLMAQLPATDDEQEEWVREVSGYMRDVIGFGSIGEFSFVLLPEQNLTIPSSGALRTNRTFADYYNSALKFSGLNAEQFYEQMERIGRIGFMPPLTQQISGNTQDYLCMVQQIPTSYLNRKAYFVSFYNTTKLSAAIMKNLPADSYFVVASSSGAPLTGNVPEGYAPEQLEPSATPLGTSIDGNHYLTFYEKSDTSGLQFYYFLPRSHVLQRILNFQKLFIAVIAGLLILCVLAAFVLASRHYLPVKKLYQQVCPGGAPQSSEFVQLSQQWSQIKRINESYVSEIYQQYQQLRAQFLTQLLTVQTDDEAALLKQVQKYNLPFTAPVFYVVIVQNYPSERLSLPDATYCPFPGTFSGTFIVNDDCADGSHIAATRRALERLEREEPAIRTRISTPVRSLCALSQCFREVSGFLGGQKEKIQATGEPVFCYPLEYELHLVQALSEGNCADCAEILNNLFAVNLSCNLPSEQMTLLCRQIVATICRFYQDMQGMDQSVLLQIQCVMASPDVSGLKQLKILCKMIAEQCNKEKGDKNRRITEAIVGYIQMHYEDSALTLNSVADACHVSYYYVSHILKDEVHQGFSDLLNGYRIEQAKKMLTDSEKTVQDIAEKVGFASANTFFRVFRKYTGVTPQQYRQKG